MKLLVFLFSLVFFTASDAVEMISWNSTDYSFGEIQHNTPATASYELTNKSDSPLVIKDVKVGCGCTSSKFSKEAVLPGETTTIEAVFNAKKIGAFTKTISVQTNLTKEPTVLKFSGEVVNL